MREAERNVTEGVQPLAKSFRPNAEIQIIKITIVSHCQM